MAMDFPRLDIQRTALYTAQITDKISFALRISEHVYAAKSRGRLVYDKRSNNFHNQRNTKIHYSPSWRAAHSKA
jgi:hypothetical protein